MIQVLDPGPLTTVQDGGRRGWAHLGVPAAGPADWLCHALANRLVGNPDDCAALEATVAGPKLCFTEPAMVAVTGAPVTVDGELMPVGASFAVRTGQVVSAGRTAGVRSYLAVAGGVVVEQILGSSATDTLSGLGPGRLRRGDRLGLTPYDQVADRPPRRLREERLPRPSGPLRVVLGPHQNWFTPPAVDTLLREEYSVTPASDRVGIRLSGPVLRRAIDGELPALGMVTGSLQVPADGQPIMLLANHGATGGYPVVAVVASADLPRAGQVRPGARLTFTAVSRNEAVAAFTALHEAMDAAVTIS